MIVNPAVIALVGGTTLVAGFGLCAAAGGLGIIRGWDLSSGAERQLRLERRTYLISTIFSRLLLFQFASLFLFVHTADHIHGLFVGAMCAAGSLHADAHGYPVLMLKMVNLVLCGLWLLVNHLDNQGHDYPLIRRKYRHLVGLSVLLALEAWWQYRYFAGLRPNVITSCCGTLFSADAQNVAGGMAGFPPRAAAISFFLGALLTVRSGLHFLITGRAARVFARFSFAFSVAALVSIISFISVYFYQLPAHHCPFCILQREYHYVGYLLYLSLLAATIPGIGVGVVDRMSGAASLRTAAPRLQRRLTAVALAGVLTFTGVTLYPMLATDFVFIGY
jgi:hypothetical protein